MEKQQHCSTCRAFGFCGLHSSVETNLKLMSAEHLVPIITANEAFQICPNQGVLKVLLQLEEPKEKKLSRVEITHPQFDNEKQAESFWLWLAGMMEQNGTITFAQAKKESGETYCWPILRFTTEDSETLEKIRLLLQIRQKANKDSGQDAQPTRLTLNRHQAAVFTRGIEPYTVSRKIAVRHVDLWAAAETHAEQMAVLARYQNQKNIDHTPNKNAYLSLIRKPDYLAGLLDARALFEDIEQDEQRERKKGTVTYHRRRRRVRLFSSNLPLLQALHDTYLGSNPNPNNRTYVWNVEGEDLENLLSFVGNDLKLKSF